MVRSLPRNHRDVYFLPEYYELWEKNNYGKATCFVFKKGKDIAVYPFLTTCINELGFQLDEQYYDIQGAYGYNGIASTTYNDAFVKSFYQEFDQYIFENKIIAEFVRYNPLLENHNFINNHAILDENREVVVSDLTPSYEYIWDKQYSSKNRNMIRKGKNTLTFSIGNSKADIKRFKTIYQYTMSRIDAYNFYHFSDKYFSTLAYTMRDELVVLTAYEKNSNEAYGALLLFVYDDYAHYFLSGRSALCDNNAVNNYLLDLAVKYAKEKKCKLFNYGGGNSSEKSDTLFRFKSNFSKETRMFYISRLIHNERVYNHVCDLWEQSKGGKDSKKSNRLLKYHE